MATEKENILEMKDELDMFLPREGNTDALFSPVAVALTEFQAETEATKQSLRPNTAQTKEQLDVLAETVKVSKKDNETTEQYRKRIETAYQNLTQNGSPESFLSFAASILNVSKQLLAIREIETEANFQIVAPSNVIQKAIGDTSLAASILFTGTASTYGVKLIQTGTLEYISQSEYTNSNYDTSAGYADAQGDTGGTYSGRYQE
jgi:hypothetical protein